jgi:ribosomal protein L11 methyltransferase
LTSLRVRRAYTEGLQSILLHPDAEERDLLTAELWEIGTVGIVEEGDRLRAFFEDAVDLTALAGEIRYEPEANIHAFSQEDWEPLLVGKKFFIAPSWVKTMTPEGRFRLTVDSATAFGTGRHETTQLVLEYLEETVRGGETVVDIGCGSGILSAGARLLGASRVVGCDIDDLAVQTAAHDFRLPVFAGSADAIRDELAHILLVNISAKVIEALASELKRIVRPRGTVVLTGFVRDREPGCFAPQQSRERGDWLCSIGTRESIAAPETPRGTILRHSANWW